MTAIAVSRLHFPVTTLGPGRRIGLWLQGCTIRCAGCISPDTWAAGEGMTDTDEVVRALLEWAPQADGLTVSGGEPFDQPEALAAVLRRWRAASPKDVLVFTGYSFDDVAPWLNVHLGLVDALVAGPFLKDAPQTLVLRGSDNQTLHLLTPIGACRFAAFQRTACEEDRRLDVMFDAEGGVWFAGIPARGDFDRLRRALRAAGHMLSPTEPTAGS